MIRIAFVINYITNNGPSNVVLDIIRNLDREQFDISLITLFEGNDDQIVADLRNDGVKILACITLSRTKCLLGQDKEFQELVKREDYHILRWKSSLFLFVKCRINRSVFDFRMLF